MKSLAIFILVVFLVCNAFATETYDFTIGVVYTDHSEYNFEEAKIVLKKCVQGLSEIENIHGNLQFYKNYDEYINALKADEVQSIMMSPSFYLTHLDEFNKFHEEGWIKDDSEPFFSYSLVGKKVTYIREKALHVAYYEYDHIAKNILDMIAKKEHKTFILHPYKKESKAIIETFLNKHDLAFVRTKVWELNKELNPQIEEKMQKVYETEKKFMRSISLLSKKLSKKNIEQYFKVLQGLHETQYGQQLMQIFKFNKLHRITTKDLKPLVDFYRDYQNFNKDLKKVKK